MVRSMDETPGSYARRGEVVQFTWEEQPNTLYRRWRCSCGVHGTWRTESTLVELHAQWLDHVKSTHPEFSTELPDCENCGHYYHGQGVCDSTGCLCGACAHCGGTPHRTRRGSCPGDPSLPKRRPPRWT